MAKYLLENDQGQKFQVEAPDDEPLDSVVATFKQNFNKQLEVKEPFNPAETGGELSFGPIRTGIKTSPNVDKAFSGLGKYIEDTSRSIDQLRGNIDRKDIDQSREIDKPLSDTKMGQFGEVAGSIIAGLAPIVGPVKKVKEGASILSKLLRSDLSRYMAARGAVSGGSAGALESVGSEDTRVGNAVTSAALGGGLGLAAPIAAKTIVGLPKAVINTPRFVMKAPAAIKDTAQAAKRAVIDPIYNKDKIMQALLRQSIGDDPAEFERVLKSLEEVRAKTPGVNLTTAEITQNSGLAGIENYLQNVAPNTNKRLSTNNQAKMGSIADQLNSASAGLDDFIKARADATAPLYEKASSDIINITPGIAKVLMSPSGQEAIKTAKKLAGNEFDLGAFDQISKIINKAHSTKSKLSVDQRHAIAEKELSKLNLSGNRAITLKKAIDDLVTASKKYTSAIGQNEIMAQNNLRNLYEYELGNVSPSFREANDKFSNLSRDVNEAEILSEIRDKVIPAFSGDRPVSLNAGELAKLLRNETSRNQLAQKATGFNSVKYEDVVSPKSRKLLDSINHDLSRSLEAQKRGTGPNSQTAKMLKMGELIDNYVGQTPSAGKTIMNAILNKPGISSIKKSVYQTAEQNILNQLDELMASNPKAIADLLRGYEKRGIKDAL